MKTLTADNLSSWAGRIIDVRSANEFAGERLPNSENVPLPELGCAARAWNRDEPLLVMCKSGVRSRDAYNQLCSAGFKNLAMLTGGIDACKSAGVNVIFVRKTIPIIRQVLIVAGGLLLAGLLLGRIDSRFLVIDWLVAAGLTFAGLTGYCPMAKLLEKMPWNRAPSCGTDGNQVKASSNTSEPACCCSSSGG